MPEQILNLFYAEPDPDRWLPLDRYPRRILRRVIRGRSPMRGQRRVFVNLCAGLRRIGVPFRVNDYKHARRNPSEIACIVGKSCVLDAMPWRNPILFGASVFSHPLLDQHLLQRLPVRRVLVPGEWMRRMFEPYYGGAVFAWPVGIDTRFWSPGPTRTTDILLYDKILWQHEVYERWLLSPIRKLLESRGLMVRTLRYGSYQEEEFHALARTCRAMVFVCFHESQGIAYQQALSCGMPIFAWDPGGEWCDPEFYPNRVKFGPVTSVPYWDDRCGLKFADVAEFESRLDEFLQRVYSGSFAPRSYVLEHLTLERCAETYLEHVESVSTQE